MNIAPSCAWNSFYCHPLFTILYFSCHNLKVTLYGITTQILAFWTITSEEKDWKLEDLKLLGTHLASKGNEEESVSEWADFQSHWGHHGKEISNGRASLRKYCTTDVAGLSICQQFGYKNSHHLHSMMNKNQWNSFFLPACWTNYKMSWLNVQG